MAAEKLIPEQMSAAPHFNALRARGIASSIFAWHAEAVALNGEIDSNFRLTDANGRLAVLKLSHASGAAAIELQNDLLDHLAAVDPDCPVPRIIRCRDGSRVRQVFDESGHPCCVRLLSYVQGTPLEMVAPDALDHEALGRAMARLDLAMASFDGPVSPPPGVWDLQSVPHLRGRLRHIGDIEDRLLAETAFDRFERHRESFLHASRQFVHNDLNPNNVLLTDGPAQPGFGFIDFGDAARSPIVGEIAIAAAYHVSPDGDPLDRVDRLVSGYDAVRPLPGDARDMLPDLIAVRLAQSLTISSWRAVQSPRNADYLLRYRRSSSRALFCLVAASKRRPGSGLM